MFVPTIRIVKLTARVRFGRDGLHPDMFRAYSWASTRTMAPLTHGKSKLEAKLQATDLAADASWRVMALRSSDVDLLKSDRRDPVYERRLPLADITRNVRERVAVRSADGIGTTICRFGEPGTVGGPGHQLVFRPGLGVAMPTSRELWRMQGSSREVADARYDLFVDTNPTASYEDLAGAASDAIAGPWADTFSSRARSTEACVW